MFLFIKSFEIYLTFHLIEGVKCVQNKHKRRESCADQAGRIAGWDDAEEYSVL